MSAFSPEERAFVASIKERKAARERALKEAQEAWAAANAKLKADFKASFDLIANAPLTPTKLLMNQADYDDIVKWQNGEP